MKEFKPILPESLLVQKPVDLDALRFVFSQVEKRVKETAEDGDRINSKSLTIIGICLTFITGLTGYVISNYSTAALPIIISACYLIVSLGYVCWIIKPNIYPIRYLSIGSYPSDLLVDKMIENLDEEETIEKRMIYSEILEYEERVMLNKHNNDNRNSLLRKSFDYLFLMPLITIGICALLFFIRFIVHNSQSFVI